MDGYTVDLDDLDQTATRVGLFADRVAAVDISAGLRRGAAALPGSCAAGQLTGLVGPVTRSRDATVTAMSGHAQRLRDAAQAYEAVDEAVADEYEAVQRLFDE
ncbi:MAG: hypothetical protein CSB46_11420 [Micrococcales bacterium]|nr:MAG: hypothetical protein CSB46_11420 [Micrococcales bacterium]